MSRTLLRVRSALLRGGELAQADLRLNAWTANKRQLVISDRPCTSPARLRCPSTASRLAMETPSAGRTSQPSPPLSPTESSSAPSARRASETPPAVSGRG